MLQMSPRGQPFRNSEEGGFLNHAGKIQIQTAMAAPVSQAWGRLKKKRWGLNHVIKKGFPWSLGRKKKKGEMTMSDILSFHVERSMV